MLSSSGRRLETGDCDDGAICLFLDVVKIILLSTDGINDCMREVRFATLSEAGVGNDSVLGRPRPGNELTSTLTVRSMVVVIGK